MIDFRTLQLP